MSPYRSFHTGDPLDDFLAARRVGKSTGPTRPIDGGDLDAAGFRTDWIHVDEASRSGVDRHRHPVDEWAWVETAPPFTDGSPTDGRAGMGVSESLFALSNGYIGLRGNPEEGRDSYAHGTFLNGLHETWDIQHAEDAYGLARAGQSIISAPCAKAMRLYIDDEPLRLGNAELLDYERRLDFRTGVLRRALTWRTPGGKTVRVTSERMVSFEERHLALMSLEVELLDADAAVVISSQLLNRQDGEDEFPHNRPGRGSGNATSADGDEEGFDPRKGEAFEERVLLPRYRNTPGPERATLGYQVNHSKMTVTASMDHELTVTCPNSPAGTAEDAGVEITTDAEDDVARVTYHLNGSRGMVVRLNKFVAYHTSRHVSPEELAFRCARTLNRARTVGYAEHLSRQEAWLRAFWERSDVHIGGQPDLQQAVRWNLFQLIQASARAETSGIPAKGMTGSGYGGHYFWDTEIYVMPFLCYTNPDYARNALRFRYNMLPAAYQRARELSHDGALFPWRTINGQESSAYYAAGTAQYHIDADIAYALMKYVYATGDTEFLLDQGIHILVGTARFWMSLGFFNTAGDRFEIHSVTGPDEYTTVVNNNLYTNVMAQYNLATAHAVVLQLQAERPEDYAALIDDTGLSDVELDRWQRAAETMYIPFNEELGINPQDDHFLHREIWDMDDPHSAPKRPLLLHYHPLTIYRYQVVKQADVVLALFLQGQLFSAAVKRADYTYYDHLTTGDSTLSAVVQSIMAAELGYADKALDFFYRGLFVDLANLHGNTADGVHIASCGGVWTALTMGFGGLRDANGRMSIHPRLPEGWEHIRYRLTLHGVGVTVTVRPGAVDLIAEQPIGPIVVLGQEVTVGTELLTITGETLITGDHDVDSEHGLNSLSDAGIASAADMESVGFGDTASLQVSE